MAKLTVIGTKEKRVEVKDLRSEKILSYDQDNLYPQRIKDSIAASVTGTAAVELFATHLVGRGFAIEDLKTLIVNHKQETLKDIHDLVCNDYSKFRGVALHIGYNGLMEVVSIKHIPFDYVRLSMPDDKGNISSCVVYEDWDGSRYGRRNKDLMKTIDIFTTDPDKINSQIEGSGGFDKWNGHILYYSHAGVLTYPSAKCDSAFEDIITDEGIKVFAQRNIQTGFMAGSVFVHKGKFEDDDARDEFVDNLKQFQGAKNSNRMMLVEAETDDQIPEVKELPIINNDKLFENTETSVRERIVRCFGQPLILHAIKTPGSLGESTEWEDAKKNYDERTEKERDRLALIYKPILEKWHDGDPSTDGNYQIIPISGIKEKAKRSVLATTIGVGGMQAMTEIIQNPALSENQKINFLIITFGISKADALALIKGDEINE
jgi:hypothetical protein